MFSLETKTTAPAPAINKKTMIVPFDYSVFEKDVWCVRRKADTNRLPEWALAVNGAVVVQFRGESFPRVFKLGYFDLLVMQVEAGSVRVRLFRDSDGMIRSMTSEQGNIDAERVVYDWISDPVEVPLKYKL